MSTEPVIARLHQGADPMHVSAEVAEAAASERSESDARLMRLRGLCAEYRLAKKIYAGLPISSGQLRFYAERVRVTEEQFTIAAENYFSAEW